jgi:hypothetical protein
MSEFEKISKRFSIATKKPAAKKEDIHKLEMFSPLVLPSDYIEFVYFSAETEILVDGKKCIRIWSPIRCIELNIEYCIQEFIPGSLIIGDDEGGNAFFYADGKEGFGLYKTGFGDLDIEDAVKIAPSLRDLLVHDIGIEKI